MKNLTRNYLKVKIAHLEELKDVKIWWLLLCFNCLRSMRMYLYYKKKKKSECIPNEDAKWNRGTLSYCFLSTPQWMNFGLLNIKDKWNNFWTDTQALYKLTHKDHYRLKIVSVCFIKPKIWTQRTKWLSKAIYYCLW